MLNKIKTVISHVFTIALILWVISLAFPTELFFKVWTGAALLAACLVLRYGVSTFLKWFLLTTATLFCIMSIWVEPNSLVFKVPASVLLLMIYGVNMRWGNWSDGHLNTFNMGRGPLYRVFDGRYW